METNKIINRLKGKLGAQKRELNQTIEIITELIDEKHELTASIQYWKKQALWAHRQMNWFASTFPEKYQNTFRCKISNPLDIVFDLSVKN